MLRLNPIFDTQKDVVSSILAKEERANIGKRTCYIIFYLCNNYIIISSSSSSSRRRNNKRITTATTIIIIGGGVNTSLRAFIVYINVYTFTQVNELV